MPTRQAGALHPETCTCTPAVRYACSHCHHDQCLYCGFCTIGSCVCPREYGLGFQPGIPDNVTVPTVRPYPSSTHGTAPVHRTPAAHITT
jgi:hypothetical protein